MPENFPNPLHISQNMILWLRGGISCQGCRLPVASLKQGSYRIIFFQVSNTERENVFQSNVLYSPFPDYQEAPCHT